MRRDAYLLEKANRIESLRKSRNAKAPKTESAYSRVPGRVVVA